MHFCSLIMILPIASIQYLIAIILNMEHTSFWYSMICTVVAFTGITFFTNTLNVSAGLKEKVGVHTICPCNLGGKLDILQHHVSHP